MTFEELLLQYCSPIKTFFETWTQITKLDEVKLLKGSCLIGVALITKKLVVLQGHCILKCFVNTEYRVLDM